MKIWKLLLLLLTLPACRSDVPNSAYEDQEKLDPGTDPGTDGTNGSAGPDPWEEGEPRLSVGTFYEGGSSQLIEVNGTNTHLYIYENTLTLETDEVHVEGASSHRITHSGGDWWGMGVHWNDPLDLSGWATLYVSFQSTTFTEIEIGMNGATDDRHVVNATTYGYTNDGEWHQLAIPLTEFASNGLDLTAVSSPLSIGGAAANEGDFALIDNLYFTDEIVAGPNRGNSSNTTEPDPFEAGDSRLSIGVFYEGSSSELIKIDNTTTHLFIYENTLALSKDSDHIESDSSDRITHKGGSWWGMGVHWDNARDLTGWMTLHISFRSSDAAFADIDIGMNGAEDDRHVVKASNYGYINDGKWHTLAIPTADFIAAGLDLTAVGSPLSLGGGGGLNTETLLIDNVYLTND